MPLTDKQKESQKKYREKHKQEIQERKKIYYQEHKKEIQEKHKEYSEAHKKEKQEYDKKYRDVNKERKHEQDKIYATTETGKKVHKINMWKFLGVICDDYNELYDKYINATECELCKTPITEGKGLIGKKCLDHDHKTGEFRNILCGHCNINVMRFK